MSECTVVQQEVVLHEDLPWIVRVKEVNNSLNLSNSLGQKKVAKKKQEKSSKEERLGNLCFIGSEVIKNQVTFDLLQFPNARY